MNYKKNYYDYANYVKNLVILKKRPKNKNEYYKLKKQNSKIYYEFHHIEMKCQGGNESIENYIPLTAREHFLAHYLLWKFKKCRQSSFAFYCLIKMGKKNNINSKLYEKLKKELNEYKYEWYNNGKKNKKIYENEKIPKNYNKGYILVQDKIIRLRKFDIWYKKEQEKLINYEEYLKEKLIKKKEQLDNWLIREQQKIFPDMKIGKL